MESIMVGMFYRNTGALSRIPYAHGIDVGFGKEVRCGKRIIWNIIISTLV
jgi:hypothetical protein